MRILGATLNENKLRELAAVAAECGHVLCSPRELGIVDIPHVDETGATYRENALLKARAFWEWSQVPTLADDSGLEVFALEGRPGVGSARYERSDGARIARVLDELRVLQSADRRAEFRCHLILLLDADTLIEAESVLPGTILEEPRGNLGFGYDPIVQIDFWGKTLAEVDFASVCRHGFRGKAARKLFARLSAFDVPHS